MAWSACWSAWCALWCSAWQSKPRLRWWRDLKTRKLEIFYLHSADATLWIFSFHYFYLQWVCGELSWGSWPSSWSLESDFLASNNRMLSTKFSDNLILNLSQWQIRTRWKAHMTRKERSGKSEILDPSVLCYGSAVRLSLRIHKTIHDYFILWAYLPVWEEPCEMSVEGCRIDLNQFGCMKWKRFLRTKTGEKLWRIS